MLDEAADGRVSLGRDRDDAAAARRYLLNIREGFFIAQLRGRVALVARGEHNYRQGLVDESVGAVLHLACRVAFGVDIGDFLQLERAFKRDGEVNAAAQVKKVARSRELLRQGLALRRAAAQRFLDFQRGRG